MSQHNFAGAVAASGQLGLRVIRGDQTFKRISQEAGWPLQELSVPQIAYHGLPRSGLDERINQWRARNFCNLMRGFRRVAVARALRLPTFYGSLFLTHIRADGQVLHLGLASMRVITTAGVNYLVDAFQNTTELENLKFHGIGTGTNAEASADTALQTESTTALNPDSTRATGSTTEGASANIYRTVGTVTVDATVACTEHGIFSQAATGGGTLWDRSVFSVINLASGDSLQATYDATFPAGS